MGTIAVTVETGIRIAAEARSAYVDSVAPIPERHEGPMTQRQSERAEAQRKWDEMPKRFHDYVEAQRAARLGAELLRRDMGIERMRPVSEGRRAAKREARMMRELGFHEFRVFVLHSDPNQRFGYEARCEVVYGR